MASRPKGRKNKKTARKTKRFCRKCDCPFLSWGPGNRLCWKCNDENAKEYDPPRARMNIPVE